MMKMYKKKRKANTEMATQNCEMQKSEQSKRNKAAKSKKHQAGLINYIMCELMWSKIRYVMLQAGWKFVLMIQICSFSFLPVCVWHTNRNVSTIQNSNGAYTHENSATECTIGHIQLFTSLITCASKR